MLPDEKSERYEYADLVDVHWFFTKPLISFLVGGSNWSLSIEDFGRLQKKGCPIDSFMFSPHFNHDDESFERNVDALQQFIFEEHNVPFSKWFEASYFYHFLQSNEFFCETRPDISEQFDELFAEKSVDYSDLDGRTNRLRIDPEDKLIYEKYEKEREAYCTQSAQNEKSDVFKRMKQGWNNVDIEIYRSHQLQPFFNQFSAQQLVECLINWENSDILLFNDFMSNRYKSTNIKTHLAEECGIISELQKEVEAMYSLEKAGRKKGALGFLKQNLSSAVKVLSGDYS